ncbi:MAG: hypothetical protein JXX29_10460 [Deltaproteobacteria bacterium]|nr:hypothetical protein [Deltaproteobacteria bacterium]MBN2672089.1 hypothetical protein [Deltaproteobacteria bacterium]
MKLYVAILVFILGAVVLAGCDDSEDSGNPCMDAIPYFEQAMETVCPSYEGCTFCEEGIDYEFMEQQECVGQARDEAEMIVDDPEGMMPSLEYTVQLMCEDELSSE